MTIKYIKKTIALAIILILFFELVFLMWLYGGQKINEVSFNEYLFESLLSIKFLYQLITNLLGLWITILFFELTENIIFNKSRKLKPRWFIKVIIIILIWCIIFNVLESNSLEINLIILVVSLVIFWSARQLIINRKIRILIVVLFTIFGLLNSWQLKEIKYHLLGSVVNKKTYIISGFEEKITCSSLLSELSGNCEFIKKKEIYEKEYNFECVFGCLR